MRQVELEPRLLLNLALKLVFFRSSGVLSFSPTIRTFKLGHHDDSRRDHVGLLLLFLLLAGLRDC